MNLLLVPQKRWLHHKKNSHLFGKAQATILPQHQSTALQGQGPKLEGTSPQWPVQTAPPQWFHWKNAQVLIVLFFRFSRSFFLDVSNKNSKNAKTFDIFWSLDWIRSGNRCGMWLLIGVETRNPVAKKSMESILKWCSNDSFRYSFVQLQLRRYPTILCI